MIKFVADNKDGRRKILGLGLTAKNVEALKAGRPIHIHSEELGLPWNADIVLFYGETEQALTEELQELIGPETDFRDLSKRRSQ